MRFRTRLGCVFVTTVNIIFIIVSLLLIVGGAIKFRASDSDFNKSTEDAIKSSLKLLVSNIGCSNSWTDSFSITELWEGIAPHLIISGCMLLFLSFFGCCGSCCQVRTLILIYGVIMTVLMVAQIIFVILMYAAPETIQGKIKDVCLDSLKNFRGIEGFDLTTVSWICVMDEMDCCGVNSYRDFSTTSIHWDRTPGNIFTPIDAPLICCKTSPAYYTDAETNCARTGTLDIHTEGCFDVVWNRVFGNPLWVGIGLGAVFTLQLLLIIFEYLMYFDLKKKSSGKVYPRA